MHRTGGGGAPKPQNWEDLVAAAASHDDLQWAVQLAKYNAQLTDAGYEVVYPPLRGRASADRLSNESGRSDHNEGATLTKTNSTEHERWNEPNGHGGSASSASCAGKKTPTAAPSQTSPPSDSTP